MLTSMFSMGYNLSDRNDVTSNFNSACSNVGHFVLSFCAVIFQCTYLGCEKGFEILILVFSLRE